MNMARQRSARSWTSVVLSMAAGVAVFALANWITYEKSAYFGRERAYHQNLDEALRHPDAHILFAGDSHVAETLDYFNDYLPGVAYSVATGGDSYRECFGKLRYTLTRRSGIDTLIISADPHMFGKGRLESSNRSFANRYFLLSGDFSGLEGGWLSALLNEVPLFNDDFVQYLRKATSARFGRLSNTVPTQKTATPWDQLPEEQRAREAIETGRMDHLGVGDYPAPFTYYARILELTRVRGIRVIGVRFPVNRLYSAQAPAAKVADIDRYLLDHGIAQIVDLRDTLQDPKYFSDPDHVSKLGARAALQMLSEQIRTPLLIGAPPKTESR